MNYDDFDDAVDEATHAAADQWENVTGLLLSCDKRMFLNDVLTQFFAEEV